MKELDGAPNFRDMGGIEASDGRRLKPGVLYRSGRLDRFTAADTTVVETLGIALVVDLRSTFEVDDDGPGHLPAGARRLHLSIGDDPEAAPIMRARSPVDLLALVGDGGSFEWARRGCASMATSELSHDRFGRAIRAIADGGVPVVFHCTAGKDRTGWLASCLLHLVGADRDVIMADYLTSNTRLRSHFDAQLDSLEANHPNVGRELVEPMMIVHPDYLEHAWAAVDDAYGSFDGYLSEALAITPDIRAHLQSTLLS